MIERIEHDRLRFEQQRRIAYRIAGAVGVLLVLYAQVTLLTVYTPGISLYQGVFVVNHIVLAGVSTWAIWALELRWMPLERLERAMLWFFAIQSLCFNSLLPALAGQSLATLLRETLSDDIWFLLMICTLALHLYHERRGVLIAMGVYVLSFAVAGAQVLRASAYGADDGSGAVLIQIYLMAGALLSFLFILARYRDHSQRLQVAFQLVERLAFIDTLTELPNRRMGMAALQSQIELAQRTGRPLSICLWDIDHFKQINDTRGHDVGDEVLRSLSLRLRGLLRESDVLARWGGEEFLLILPGSALADALRVAERLRLTLAGAPLAGGVPVTASFGVSSLDGAQSLEQLLRQADQALYAAKAGGRNQVRPSANALAENTKASYASSAAEGDRHDH